MKQSLASIVCICLLIGATSPRARAQQEWGPFKPGASPSEIGKRVAERFLATPHGVYNAPGVKPHIPYFEVCTWYGALCFAGLTGDDSIRDKLIARFEPLFGSDSSLLPTADHVDFSVFGALPLEINAQLESQKYRQLGMSYADAQWGAPFGPRATPQSDIYFKEGYSWQTRLWIDDMYMITLLQTQAYRATRDLKYIERTAREMLFYLERLQKPNGLFFHASDIPMFWGRGNGWMAAGMTELLRVLPTSSSYHDPILKAYQRMMATLLKYQAPDGMWRQLIDDSTSWKESSGTGMFTYAMITGVTNGWLDASIYLPAARRAWNTLITYLDGNADMTQVCEGTGARNDRQYYLDRKRITGDFHGQAPLLWCVNALLRQKEN